MDTRLAAGGLAAIGLPLIMAAGLAVPVLRRVIWRAAPWSAAPAAALAVWTTSGAVVEVPWLLLGTRLAFDDTARVFLVFTAVLWIACGQYARTAFRHDPKRHHVLAFLLVSMAGNLGVVLAADMVTFYVFFALMSFASYGLIVHERQAEALRAGRVYIVFVIAGEVLLFIGFVGSAGIAGQTGFPAGAEALLRSPSGHFMLLCTLVGFGIKMGTVPLHVWMPLAYSAAPIAASAALSGPMIKAGLLGWLRFMPLGVMALPFLGTACVVGGFISAFWGVLVGLTQKDPKVVLAYSSISQMGLIATGVGIGLLAPESWELILPAIYVFAAHHACAKAALFLGVGVASQAAGDAWRRRMITAGLMLPALALAGLPLSSGAVAKIALKKGIESASVPYGWPVELLQSIAAIGTTLLMARFLILVGSRRSSTPVMPGAGLWMSWAVSLASVALLVWALPWPGFRSAAFDSLTPAYLWATLWPLTVGIGIAAAAWRMPRLFGSMARISVPPGDVLALLPTLLGIARRTHRTPERPVSVHAILRGAERASAANTLAGYAAGMESGLQRWGAVGAFILALIATLFALLAA